MKKILILSMAAFLVFGFTSIAASSLIINGPDLVQFYADDDNHDSKADIRITGINFPTALGTLEYRVDGGQWTGYSIPDISVPIGQTFSKALVELRILRPNNDFIYSAERMEFSGENSDHPNHYDSLQISWKLLSPTGLNIDYVGNVDGADNVSPVPLPGAVWLLGAGILGLVGVRRKIPTLKA